MKIMAFIPARGGSKGILKKNLYPLCGKPLILYTLDAVKESRFINDIFISSDNDEIIDYCIGQGFEVPYKRPVELALDTTSMMDAIDDCFRWLKQGHIPLPDVFILLQPTSPLRTVEDIDQAIVQFLKDTEKSLVSVNKMIEHPYECIKLTKDSFEYLDKPKKKYSRRQDYENNFYFINGAIYIAQPEFLLRHKSFIVNDETEFYVMPKERSIDVDDMNGIRGAEVYLNIRNERYLN
ncbi:MAG: acylneuraminate cytidylyltransferase family protein [Nitrospirae bacterium]|nr:acylneuraminate cytidylyltransferase family protein [Nitrospirota bacterium]MBF0540420.1 acylneuraminate cytidylyltransferase family protein [Nitrospirota bacterium]